MPLLLVLLSACSPISSTYSSPVPPRCGFARDYTVAELVSQPARQQQFLAQVMQAEAAFFRPNVSYVAATAMTLDGSILNYTSGLPLAMHDFSAPSKESAMLMLMARALNGSHLAQLFFAQDAGSLPAVRAHILTLLQRKLAALETFNATYPGFGGHLPWYTHDLSRTRIVPNPDWADPYRVSFTMVFYGFLPAWQGHKRGIVPAPTQSFFLLFLPRYRPWTMGSSTLVYTLCARSCWRLNLHWLGALTSTCS